MDVTSPMDDTASMDVESMDVERRQKLQHDIATAQAQLGCVIRGKDDVIERVLIAVLSGGSLLVEDVPGVGKTTLAKSLASLIDLEVRRVQCTPDLLPSDILGGSIYQPSTADFEFRPGPVFCNLLIADEINRASPRTQSALLEAMAESQVTIDGSRYDLKRPFLVIATQNPYGSEGTFPLPESQLDRFLMRLSMGYPDFESEIDLMLEARGHQQAETLAPVLSRGELIEMQGLVEMIHVDRKVAEFLVKIIHATRSSEHLSVGCSPRGSKMLLRAAQARAALVGRSFVLPDDVLALAVPVLSHRVSPRSLSLGRNDVESIIAEIVGRLEVPV